MQLLVDSRLQNFHVVKHAIYFFAVCMLINLFQDRLPNSSLGVSACDPHPHVNQIVKCVVHPLSAVKPRGV